MGVFDTVIVPCLNCGEKHEFQSKSGDCFLEVYSLDDCPDDVMVDINRHSPYHCKCGTEFKVDIENKTPQMEINQEKELRELLYIVNTSPYGWLDKDSTEAEDICKILDNIYKKGFEKGVNSSYDDI